MPVDLTLGNSIIGAYLKGVAIKQAKEKQNQDLLLAQEEMKLKEQQLNQNLNIANRRFDEQQRRTDLENKARMAAHAVNMFNAKTKWAELVYNDLVRPLNPAIAMIPFDETTYRYTTPEERSNQKIKEKVNEQTAMNDPLIALERGKSQARVPATMAVQLNEAQLREQARKQERTFIAEQNEKNRQAAWNRASLAADTRLQISKEQKQSLVSDAVAQSRPEVLEGALTIEDINKNLTGENKSHVANAHRKDGLRIIHDQDREDLKTLPLAQNFLEKLRDLNKFLNESTDPIIAQQSPEYVAKLAGIQQDLDAWGRAVKGFKGMITERDTQRLEGGIPKALPGGWRGTFQDREEINKINKSRVDSVEKFIIEKFNRLTYGMNPEQKEAIRERYGVIRPTLPKNIERIQQ